MFLANQGTNNITLKVRAGNFAGKDEGVCRSAERDVTISWFDFSGNVNKVQETKYYKNNVSKYYYISKVDNNNFMLPPGLIEISKGDFDTARAAGIVS